MGLQFITDNNQFLADDVTPNPNYGVTTQIGEPDPEPQPNTPNNPYFGKGRLTGAAFLGICIGVLGPASAARVTSAKSFDAIKTWVLSDGVIIDVDDKDGQFLALAGIPGGDGYLTTALADDGQLLMMRQQRDAIMTAWK